ncbi:hypothetical protein ACFQX4_17140 [Roseomonas sp. GCM10028921]
MSGFHQAVPDRISAEKLAYWYFRLNGFLQIENFYVHPRTRGGARTDADLLAVRFPHRQERLYDNPRDIMADDMAGLGLTCECADVVIAEVKLGRCALNGPWTEPSRQNLHRVLAALGCVPQDRIDAAAAAIYKHGYVEDGASLRVRLVALGMERCDGIAARYPRVIQTCWADVLKFTYHRFRRYRHQKSDTTHWDGIGKRLKLKATTPDMTEDAFVTWALAALNPALGGTG